LLAISHIYYLFVRQFHRRLKNHTTICNSCHSAQPILHHGMSPNLPNPVSAPRDKTNRNQYIEGRGRVTGRFSKVGFSYSVSKTITAAPVPTIHSLPFHVRRCRPFSNKSAQIQSTHGGRAYHKDSCRCCRTAIYPRRQLCRSWPRWCDDEDEQMHDFSSCARISAKADTGVSRRRSAQIKTHGSCQSPIAQGS
jgi:hypothetical protein